MKFNIANEWLIESIRLEESWGTKDLEASAKELMFSIDRDRMENENLGAGNLQWDVELFRLLESTPRDSLCVIAT